MNIFHFQQKKMLFGEINLFFYFVIVSLRDKIFVFSWGGDWFFRWRAFSQSSKDLHTHTVTYHSNLFTCDRNVGFRYGPIFYGIKDVSPIYQGQNYYFQVNFVDGIEDTSTPFNFLRFSAILTACFSVSFLASYPTSIFFFLTKNKLKLFS